MTFVKTFFNYLKVTLCDKNTKHILVILTVALVSRFFFLGAYPLMDPTESRYAEISREMLVLDDWVTPHFDPDKPFYGKPPLTFWLTAISFKLFGVNEFSARLPSFFESFAVLILTTFFSTLIYGRTIGLVTALILTTSGLFYVHSGFVSTDNTFGVFITLALIGFAVSNLGSCHRPLMWLMVAYSSLALAVLSKGLLSLPLILFPVGVLVLKTGLKDTKLTLANTFLGILLFLMLTVPWHLLAENRNPGFLNYYIIGEHFNRFFKIGWEGNLYGKSHDEYFGTIWLYALIGFFPWFFPILSKMWNLSRAEIRKKFSSAISDPITCFLLCWLSFPLLIFTFAGNILIPYVYPSLPAFSILAARILLNGEIKSRLSLKTILKYSCVMPIGFFFTAMIILPKIGSERSQINLVSEYLKFQKDPKGELVYLESKPYSADFYLGKNVRDISKSISIDLDLELTNANDDCYAVRKLNFHTYKHKFKNFNVFDINERFLLICEPQKNLARIHS